MIRSSVNKYKNFRSQNSRNLNLILDTLLVVVCLAISYQAKADSLSGNSFSLKNESRAHLKKISNEKSVASSIFRPGNWSTGGFVDFRLRDGDFNSENKGFSIHDGAFKAMGNLDDYNSILLDISFGWIGPQDTNNDGESDDYSNSWGLATERAQAVFSHSGEKLSYHIGQFDSPVGYESNDSVDLHFAEEGVQFEFFTPTTHIGVKLEYQLTNNLAVHGIVSNPGGQGSYAEESPEYIVQLPIRSSDKKYYLMPGYYTRQVQNETIGLVNIYGGMESRIVDLHIEYNQLDTPGTDDPASGFMFMTNWKPLLRWQFGIRMESVADYNLVNEVGTDVIQYSLALTHQPNDWMIFRTDITSRNTKVTNQESDDRQQVNFIFIHML